MRSQLWIFGRPPQSMIFQRVVAGLLPPDWPKLQGTSAAEGPSLAAGESTREVHARSADPEKIRQALTKTNFYSDIVTREGNIYFDETGQCPSNLRALLQILDGRVCVIDPPQFAEKPLVFPIPKA